MVRIICFDQLINNCYYSSSEPVTDEEDELWLQSDLYREVIPYKVLQLKVIYLF